VQHVHARKICPIALVICGCGQHRNDAAAGPQPLETAIARELTGRFASPATASCDFFGATPTCDAEVLGVTLPIRVTGDGKAWNWALDGHFIAARPIAAYIDQELVDLHVKQTASCGAPVQKLPADGRIACALSGGGTAFVEIDAQGAIRIELELEREGAAIRAEPVTEQRTKELEQKSHALEQQLDVDER
jgi:hypothetical protein